MGSPEYLEQPSGSSSFIRQDTDILRESTPRPSLTETQSTPTCSSRHIGKKKNVSTIENKKEAFLEVATSVMSQQTSSKAFGNNIAFQLEDLERRQRIIAEKLIGDVLFHAKLGNLTETSSILTAVNSQQAFTISNFTQPQHYQFPQGHHPLQHVSTMPHSFNSPPDNHQIISENPTQHLNYLPMPRTALHVTRPSSTWSSTNTTVSTSLSSREDGFSNSQTPVDPSIQEEEANDAVGQFLVFGKNNTTNIQKMPHNF